MISLLMVNALSSNFAARSSSPMTCTTTGSESSNDLASGSLKQHQCMHASGVQGCSEGDKGWVKQAQKPNVMQLHEV